MVHSKNYGFVTYRRDVVEDNTHKRVSERRLQSLTPELIRGIKQSPEQNTLDLYETRVNNFEVFRRFKKPSAFQLTWDEFGSEIAGWVDLKAQVMATNNELNLEESKVNKLRLEELAEHFFAGQIALKSVCFAYLDQLISEEDDESVWEELSESPEGKLREEAETLRPAAEAMDLLGWLLTTERWYHNNFNPELYHIDRLLEIAGALPGNYLYTPRFVGNEGQKKVQYQYVEDCDEDS